MTRSAVWMAAAMLVLCSVQQAGAQQSQPEVMLQAQGRTQPSQPATVLPIVAWWGLFGPSATAERFAEMAAAGFTHNLGWFGSVEELREAMDAAAPAGIKLIARAPLLDSDPEAFAAQVKNHPAFGGYLITDEPGASRFDQLGQLVRRLQAVDPDHLCYINLFPDWADGAKQMETKTYQEYLDQFIQKVPVQVISFDHYPVVEGGITGTFYRNLEEISRAAAQAGKPFWAFALSIPHANHPIPTLAHLRFQQYTNLACGAQGLQYFTYTTPAMDEYGAGPLDRDLKRTPIYDLLVQLNRELRAQAWVFLGSRVLSVGHTGSHSPQDAAVYAPADPIRGLEVKGRGAVVSLLENKGRRRLVIVNHSYAKPAQVQVSWDPAFKMQQVDKAGQTHDLPGGSLDQPLEAGDAMILTWGTALPASGAAPASGPSPTSTPAGSPGTASARTVHFPKDRSLGVLEIQDETEDQPTFQFTRRTSDWTSLAPAMGDVAVPAGKRLRLIVWPAEVANLPALRQLRPDDLYGLMVFAQEFGMGPTVLGPPQRGDMRAVAHLTGLRSLEMWEARRFDLNLLKGMKSLEHLKLVNGIDRSAEPSDADLAIISQLTSLRRLSIGGPRFTDKGLAHLTNLRGLEELWIGLDKVTPAGLAQLAQLPSLTHLALGGLKFSDEYLSAARRIGSLKTLHLGWLPVTDEGLRLLSGHPNLETLYLYHTGVTDAGMAYLRGLPSLKRLDLSHTRVGDAGARHLKEIKTLEELMMPDAVAWGEGPYAALTDAGLADLCELSNLRRLEWYSVGRNRSRECPISDAGIAHLARLKHLEGLTIAGTGITDEGMETIAALAGLRELMIHVCPNVTDAGLAKLSRLGQLNTLDMLIETVTTGALAHLDLPHLRILRVDDLVRNETPLDISKLTALEDLTLTVQHGPALRDEDLACLAGLTHLKRLQVSSRYLTDAGMARLAGLTELELLGTGGPQVTDAGLRHLEGMTRLNSLYLTVGSLGEDGLRSLMKLKSLRMLTITSKQPVDQAALARLKAKLPTLISIENHKYKPPRKPRKSPSTHNTASS